MCRAAEVCPVYEGRVSYLGTVGDGPKVGRNLKFGDATNSR